MEILSTIKLYILKHPVLTVGGSIAIKVAIGYMLYKGFKKLISEKTSDITIT